MNITRVPFLLSFLSASARAPAKHRIISGRARSGRPVCSEDHRVIRVDCDWCRNRVPKVTDATQHALRAFTPEDAKALKATVSTFPHSGYDLEELLTQPGTGEAVITVLSERGAPTPVAWTRMRAPKSAMASSTDSVVQQVITASSLKSKYAGMVDRDSAYEKLQAGIQAAPTPGQTPAPAHVDAPAPASAGRQPKAEESMVEQVVTSGAFRSILRSAGTVLGREITRSIFGTARRRR